MPGVSLLLRPLPIAAAFHRPSTYASAGCGSTGFYLLKHLLKLFVQFQNALLQAADGDGGSEAASRLYHAIRDHIASLYNNSSNWPVVVQIYLSLDKLAIKLALVGLLRSPSDLRSFVQHFNVNQPLFSIVDVGHGKERADHKIKGITGYNPTSSRTR